MASWPSNTFQKAVGITNKWTGSGYNLVVLDQALGALLEIDMDSFEVSELSANGRDGIQFESASNMSDRWGGEVIVWDSVAEMLVGIDLDSGARRLVADNEGTGAGPQLGGMAVAVADGMAYLFPGEDLIRIDLASGDRELLPAGEGRLSSVSSVFFDPAAGELVSWSAEENAMVAISTSDWSATTLFSGEQQGLDFTGGRQIVRDDESYLINGFAETSAADNGSDAILTTVFGYDARVLLEDSQGEHGWDPVATLALAGGPGELFIADQDGTAMYYPVRERERYTPAELVSPEDSVVIGDDAYVLTAWTIKKVALDGQGYTMLSNNHGHGDGPGIAEGSGIAAGPAGSLLMTDAVSAALMQVDQLSGDRSIVSDYRHAGPELRRPIALAYDEESKTAYISDSALDPEEAPRLLAVDLKTGERRLVSSDEQGSGPAIIRGLEVEVVPGGDALIVNDGDRILRVDLSSGDRELVSGRERGRGEVFANLSDIALDHHHQVIYAWSSEREALLQIEVQTGDRVVVAK